MRIFQDKQNKPSPKRIVGTVVLGVVLVAFVFDGLDKYNINENVASALIYASAGMLGITAFEKPHGEATERTEG